MKWWHRIQLADGTYTPGEVVHGPDGGDWPHTRFGLPKDLTGKTVLDVGCWDGFFSFKCEALGAVVTAVDNGQHRRGTDGFKFAKQNLKSNVDYWDLDIQADTLYFSGESDIVLCYGVLYHLTNPLAALLNLRKMTKEYALIETAISDIQSDRAVYEFKPGHDGDPTNYWYPNVKGLEDSILWAGFSKVEVVYNDGSRVTIKALV